VIRLERLLPQSGRPTTATKCRFGCLSARTELRLKLGRGGQSEKRSPDDVGCSDKEQTTVAHLFQKLIRPIEEQSEVLQMFTDACTWSKNSTTASVFVTDAGLPSATAVTKRCYK
jgi:hypothetical protein